MSFNTRKILKRFINNLPPDPPEPTEEEIYDNTTLTATVSTIIAVSEDGVIMTLDPISTPASILNDNPNYIERWKFGNTLTLINNPHDSSLNNITYVIDGASWLWYTPHNGGFLYSIIYYDESKWVISFGIYPPENSNCISYILYSYASDPIDIKEPYSHFPKTNWKKYVAKTITSGNCIENSYASNPDPNSNEPAFSYLMDGLDYDPPVNVNLNFSFSAPTSRIPNYSVAVKKIRPPDTYTQQQKNTFFNQLTGGSDKFNYIQRMYTFYNTSPGTVYACRGPRIFRNSSPDTLNSWVYLGTVLTGLATATDIACIIDDPNIYTSGYLIFTNNGIYKGSYFGDVYDPISKTDVVIRNYDGTIATNNINWAYVSLDHASSRPSGYGISEDGILYSINQTYLPSVEYDVLINYSKRLNVDQLTRDSSLAINKHTTDIWDTFSNDSRATHENPYLGSEGFTDTPYWFNGDTSILNACVENGYSTIVSLINTPTNTFYFISPETHNPYLYGNYTFSKINGDLKAGNGRNSIIFDTQQRTFIILPSNHKNLIYIKEEINIDSGPSNSDEFYRIKTVSQIPVSKNWTAYSNFNLFY